MLGKEWWNSLTQSVYLLRGLLRWVDSLKREPIDSKFNWWSASKRVCPPQPRFLTLNCWVEAWILWLPDSKERKVRGGMMTDIEEKVGVRRWKMSTRQHNYREGLFKHVYLHPLHSVFSLRARGTSCCTLLPQKHTTVTHPALHPVLTKHSVTVSETSLSTFASYSMRKTELSHHQINRSQHQIFESRLRFMVQYIKGLERWYSITNTHIYPLIYFSAFLK